MKKLILGFFVVMAIFTLPAAAYSKKDILKNAAGTPDQVKQMLVLDQKWVNYPDYTDRKGWDEFLGDWKQIYIDRGVKCLEYKWQVVPVTTYLDYERIGNRSVQEGIFGANCNAVADLMMAELAEGEGRFMDQLMNGMFCLCEASSWDCAAHLSVFQSTHRSIPDNRSQKFDLSSGNISSTLSWLYFFFKDALDKVDPALSNRLYRELKERCLDAFLYDDGYWWMGIKSAPGTMLNNWTPWCCFNALQSFMLLENDPDTLAAAVYKSLECVDRYLDYCKADGACEEGPSYWFAAAGKLYDYLDALYKITGGKIDVFGNKMIRDMGEYISRSYIGNGWVVNFADASARGGGGHDLIYRYGKAVGSNEMIKYAAYQLSLANRETPPSGNDITRTLETIANFKELRKIEPVLENPPYVWYPETEFCYMRDTKNDLFFASKGGFNDESHNHNDIGSFVLYKNSTPVIIDVGVGTYTRETFSANRYKIWTMQGNYHNIPMVNGIAQQHGKQYKATDASFNPAKMTFSQDFVAAYPEEAGIKSWIRSYTLKNGILKISDKFSLAEAKESNIVNFMTWGDVDIATPGVVKISVKGESVAINYDKAKFEASIERIAVEDPNLTSVWGKEVFRVSLTAKNAVASGTYSFTVNSL